MPGAHGVCFPEPLLCPRDARQPARKPPIKNPAYPASIKGFAARKRHKKNLPLPNPTPLPEYRFFQVAQGQFDLPFSRYTRPGGRLNLNFSQQVRILFLGSSRFSGEGGLDLQEEIG